MYRKTLALAIPLLLVTAGCGSIGLGGASSISLDQEWQLGQQMAAQVEQSVRLVRDPQALAYVRMVGERIHAVTPLARYPFDFEIVNDSSVNAFSIPGGHVYINTGLIAQADKVDMLAGVMAHEISHIVHRDVLKQVEQQQEISTIGSILLGQNPNALSQIVAQVLAGGAMAHFSRGDEKAADDAGLQFMTAAGYDPHGMLEMFEKLLALDRGGNSSVARFFQDHPGTQDRINDITSRINAMGRTSGIVDDPDYQAIRRRIT
jgi:beta-barrel assembly-enhancing protease